MGDVLRRRGPLDLVDAVRLPWIGDCTCGRARAGSTRDVIERWEAWHLGDACEGCDHVVHITLNDPDPPLPQSYYCVIRQARKETP